MTVILNLRPMKRFQATVKAQSGPVKKALKQWVAIYRAFVQERFDKYSKGGGDWPPLSPKTIAARRKARKKKKGRRAGRIAAILVDTGTLKGGLHPRIRKPGRFDRKIPFGVEVGFGGPDKHLTAKKLTIAALARIHHFGLGKVPARPIIVEPDSHTRDLMIKVMEKALERA